LDKFILLGHSFGGCLALAYTLHYGHRVDGLVLCAATPNLEHLQSEFASLFDQMTPEQQAALARLGDPIHDDSAFKEALHTLLPLYFAKYRPEHEEAFFGRMRCSAAAWNHLASITEDVNACAAQYRPKCNALLLNGKHDWYTNSAQVRRLRDSLPQADLVELENSGHFPFIEEPERFLMELRDWITSLP
jgi:proline iminopeptidase